MTLFGQIKNSVNSILPSLYSDPELTTLVTWKKFKDSEFDENVGVNIDTYTDYKSIAAIRVEKQIGTDMSRASNPPGGIWNMASGEVVYLFQAADVPTGASIRDLLIDGDFTYSVAKLYPVYGLIVKVEVKGYA